MFFFIISFEAVGESLPESFYDFQKLKFDEIKHRLSKTKDEQLPTALKVIENLRFLSLHGEASFSTEQTNWLKNYVIKRLKQSPKVSLKKSDKFPVKVPARKLEINGFKIRVPQWFKSKQKIFINDFGPQKEAGVLFPTIWAKYHPEHLLKSVRLFVNGQEKKNLVIGAKTIIWQPILSKKSLFKFGRYKVKLQLIDKTNNKIEKIWFFTVGEKSFNPEEIPSDSHMVKEFSIAASELISSHDSTTKIRVIIYQTKDGRIFEKYLLTQSGVSLETRNLKLLNDSLTRKSLRDDLQILPLTDRAFPGNKLNFHCSYNGPGEVLESLYSLKGIEGPWVSGSSHVKILKQDFFRINFKKKIKKKDPLNEGEFITFWIKAEKTVNPIIPKLEFNKEHNYVFTNKNSGILPFYRNLKIRGISEKLKEGEKFSLLKDGILNIAEFRAKIINSSGSVELKDAIATRTEIIFDTPGFIEITQTLKMTYSYSSEQYDFEMTDEKSTLNAWFKVKGECNFIKYPTIGLISGTEVFAQVDKFKIVINGKKRVFQKTEDLQRPWVLLSSQHDSSMVPIKVNELVFSIKNEHSRFYYNEFGFEIGCSLTEETLFSEPTLFARLNYDKVILTNLPSFKVFPRETAFCQGIIALENLTTMYEGSPKNFSLNIYPMEGMGSGTLTPVENNLEILDFYHTPKAESVYWYGIPVFNKNQKTETENNELKFKFDPLWGPGNYELNADALIEITDDFEGSFLVKVKEKKQIKVLPGLKILSPIEELAYPLNARIEVNTSVDDEIEKLKNIQWFINGKEFTPPDPEQPFHLKLTHSGNWSIEARLKIENNEETDPTELVDKVEFTVQPLHISLTPAKKVFPLNQSSGIEVRLNVELNDEKVEKPGEIFTWQEDWVNAVIDPVAWDSVISPENCATAESNPESFLTEIDFSNNGAITLLATVTMRLVGAEKLFNVKNPGFEKNMKNLFSPFR
ncbi:MAG: hypothetical protein ACQETH_08130 [Candidatus Rifleibacteriota bacterium]